MVESRLIVVWHMASQVSTFRLGFVATKILEVLQACDDLVETLRVSSDLFFAKSAVLVASNFAEQRIR